MQANVEPIRYALVYCGWLLFEFIFIFRYIIETKGRSLEQTAALFDGEDHADALGQGTCFSVLLVLPQLSVFSPAGYDAARHTQIRTRDYEHYDYFSVYIDREDSKVYELRQVDHSEPTTTRAQRQRARRPRQPSENSMYADHSGYRY